FRHSPAHQFPFRFGRAPRHNANIAHGANGVKRAPVTCRAVFCDLEGCTPKPYLQAGASLSFILRPPFPFCSYKKIFKNSKEKARTVWTGGVRLWAVGNREMVLRSGYGIAR